MPGPRQTALGQYQANYLKALRDPKYAAEQRIRAEAIVKESAANVAELTKKYNNAQAEWKKQDEIVRQKAALLAANPGNSTYESQLKTAEIARANARNDSNTYNQQLAEAKVLQEQRQSYLFKLSGVTATPVKTLGKGGKGGKNTGGTKAQVTNPADFKFKYNAPMVKWAYFNSASGVPISIDFIKSKSNTPQKMDNARQAFKLAATRGAIQTSPEIAQFLKTRSQSKAGKSKDNTNYGFRFHYNPTGIGMSYGMLTDMSPEQLASGNDKLNMITPLQRGGWSIDLYLNRMEDFSYINPDGSLVNGIASTDVYPEPVDSSELKQIYEKGTMYDLDYLFRSVNGPGGTYDSELRGKTADIGWITGVAVEFHMGNGLRYLGQITNVDINHAVFNERMVPMLTTVTIKASRFYDDFLTNNKGKKS
jgi:hypothetical protein